MAAPDKHMWPHSEPPQHTRLSSNPRVSRAYCRARTCTTPGCGSTPALVIFLLTGAMRRMWDQLGYETTKEQCSHYGMDPCRQASRWRAIRPESTFRNYGGRGGSCEAQIKETKWTDLQQNLLCASTQTLHWLEFLIAADRRMHPISGDTSTK